MTRKMRASNIGIGDFFLSVYNTRKIRKNSSVLGNQSSAIATIDKKMNLLFDAQRKTSQMVMENTLATMGAINGLMVLRTEVQNLSENTWEVLNFMTELDRKEELLGTLRLFLIEVEDEIERISKLRKNYPEFASAILDELSEVFKQHDVRIEKFKRMHSVEDIKWAKNVIKRLENLHYQDVIERESNKQYSSEYNLFIETLSRISQLEQQIVELTPMILRQKNFQDLTLEEYELILLYQRKDFLTEKYSSIENRLVEIKSVYESELKELHDLEAYNLTQSDNSEVFKQMQLTRLIRGKKKINGNLNRSLATIAPLIENQEELSLTIDGISAELSEYCRIDLDIIELEKKIKAGSSKRQNEIITSHDMKKLKIEQIIKSAKEVHKENISQIAELEEIVSECYESISHMIPNQMINAETFSSFSRVNKEYL